LLCPGGDIIRPACILLIENDEALRARIATTLERAGFEVTAASDALEGLKRLYESHADLVIMAQELPMVDGEEPCLRIRQASCLPASYLPIIVLGNDEEGAAEMLELGADAYITKPPSLSELVARVHSLLRRKLRYDSPRGNPRSEIRHRLNSGDDGSNDLTRTEFCLASCLVLNKGKLLSYRQLIDEVWGGKPVSIDNLHLYIRRLRQKLANISIFRLRGVGYCFSGDGGPAPDNYL